MSNNIWGSCLSVILVLIAIIWIASKLHDNYINGEKKPFWEGTENIQVCKAPYYSSSDCYRLDVTLLDEETARISFSNGGYVVTGDLTCYFAASFGDTPRYVFCRSWDDNDDQWDFMPAWVNY